MIPKLDIKRKFIMKKLFINRKEELKKLVNGLKLSNDFVLVAPRRFGKTALAIKALEEIVTDPQFIVIDIDLMKYSGGGVQSIAECIIERSLNALGISGKIRKMWREVNFNFSVSVKYKELEIAPLLQLFNSKKNEWKLLEESLDLFEKIANLKQKHVVVFYDEFGELYSLGTRVIKMFRSVIQRHTKVSYLFAGSQETVMNKIFLEKSGAFYRFGELIYLKELDKKDVFDYLVDKFPQTNILKNDLYKLNIADSIIYELKGHPYYTAQAINYLEQNHDQLNLDNFEDFLFNQLFDREEAYIELQVTRIKARANALEVMRLISLKLNPYNELVGVKDQNVYSILRYLVESGYIHKESRGVYTITDPLLEKYLSAR